MASRELRTIAGWAAAEPTHSAQASIADRAEIACIGRERADLVVAGCAILESIIDLWPAARVGVADRGIREGILRTLAMQGRDIPVTRREYRK